jgi:cytochrome c biogenesis protein
MSSELNAANPTHARRRVSAFEAGLDGVLRLLSSVRFGIVLLALLILGCFLGMAVMQSNVSGFEEYYATLTNSEKIVFNALGLFNVYATWWFQLLLAMVSLTIILASIDHFPAAWRYVSRPKYVASIPYIKRQQVHEAIRMEGDSQEEIAGRIKDFLQKAGLRARVQEKGGLIHVFGQRNAWNRLGAYFVHIALLVIFAAGFVTFRFGQNGQMPLRHGETSTQFLEFVQELEGPKQIAHTLPFSVRADRIEQVLLDPAGSLDPSNTLDWRTYVTITDGGSAHQAIVYLNHPYDYRGYRFFQSGFDSAGDASAVTIAVVRDGAEEQKVLLQKGTPADLPGLGKLTFIQFIGDFNVATKGPASDTYDNPVAFLQATGEDGSTRTVLACNRDLASEIGAGPMLQVDGIRFVLDSYAKSNSVHYLSVQKDPGATMFYAGSLLLGLALGSVFLFSHQRVWAIVPPVSEGSAMVALGGHANRHKQAFEERFRYWVRALVDPHAAIRVQEADDDE